MASGQRQEIHQAPRLGAGGGERFPGGERIHLSGPRYRPAAIELLRCSDREWRTLFPDWSSPEIFVHVVYPTRRFLPAKLQVFLKDLKAWKSPLWIPLR